MVVSRNKNHHTRDRCLHMFLCKKIVPCRDPSTVFWTLAPLWPYTGPRYDRGIGGRVRGSAGHYLQSYERVPPTARYLITGIPYVIPRPRPQTYGPRLAFKPCEFAQNPAAVVISRGSLMPHAQAPRDVPSFNNPERVYGCRHSPRKLPQQTRGYTEVNMEASHQELKLMFHELDEVGMLGITFYTNAVA